MALTAGEAEFRRFIELGGKTLRAKMDAAVVNQMRNILLKLPLFVGIGDAFVDLVCEHITFREAKPGERIVEQGDESSELLVLVSGGATESLEYLDISEEQRVSLLPPGRKAPPPSAHAKHAHATYGDPRVAARAAVKYAAEYAAAEAEAADGGLPPPAPEIPGVPLATLGDGDYFAFASLLFRHTSEPYTVTATSPCVLLAVGAREMQEVLALCAPLRAKLEARWALVQTSLRRDRTIATAMLRQVQHQHQQAQAHRASVR